VASGVVVRFPFCSNDQQRPSFRLLVSSTSWLYTLSITANADEHEMEQGAVQQPRNGWN
jgi:hypothetical protein